ncbi:MAG TPA: cell division protein FtsH, partial [Clostridiales bacterium]|nr:cell division protein FtsH [Clostridiales bacterium]
RITVALAGRAAEQVVFNEISSGAHDDLEKATRLARKMIMEFGMSEELGPLTFGQKYDSPFLGRDMARDRDYSEEVAAAIDREIRAVIHECYTRATELLQKHRDRLEQIADALLERETLEDQDLEEVLGKAELKLATGQ